MTAIGTVSVVFVLLFAVLVAGVVVAHCVEKRVGAKGAPLLGE